jgi:hypothetical protein
MSSDFLYIGIVAIWAFVLIPRWLRRPQSVVQQPVEAVEFEGDDDYAYTEKEEPLRPRQIYAPLISSKVLQARRRMLTMLVALGAIAGVCTYLKVANWWVCVPTGLVLGFYLLLLRTAARVDDERARWWTAEYERQQEARDYARAVRVEQTAEVIDISSRINDQLYDQYADATIRAVGD